MPRAAARSTPRESENHLATYVRAVNQIPPLEKDEEIQLAHEIQKGNLHALERLTLAHLSLAVKIARNYQRSTIALMDLINEGNIGLMRAARKYNPEFGLRFASYASWWVKQRISIYLIQHGRGAISVPIRKVIMFKAISKETQLLQNRLHRKPTLEELSAHMQVDHAILQETVSAIPEYISMDDYLQRTLSSGATGKEPEQTSEVESRLERNTFHKDLVELLANLSEKEKKGVILFYGLVDGEDMSYADLGRRLKISREGARQLIRRSLNKIRLHPKVELLKEYL